MKARERNAELAPRAARLRAQKKVEQQMSSDDSDGHFTKRSQQARGPKASSSRSSTQKHAPSRSLALKGKKKKVSVKPGPTIVGASLRIDVWPEESAEEVWQVTFPNNSTQL